MSANTNGPKRATDLYVANSFANSDLLFITQNVQSDPNTNVIQAGTLIGNGQFSANGYFIYPSGLIDQWGWVSANSTYGPITFPVPFTVNAFNVVATANTPSVHAGVVGVSSSGANIYTSSAASTNVFWRAVGK